MPVFENGIRIHGEVALSGKPSWSHDAIGTQVLIPVYGGMIEFYISKQVERDQKMIDTLNTQFNIFSQHIEQLKTEGSLNSSNPFSENSSLVSAGSTRVSPTQSIDKPTNLLGRSEQAKKHTNSRQRTSKGQCQSKNLVAERNRRHRINDGLFALRALVPNISRMNRAAIVGDAIDYIKELQTKVQELQEELERLEEDDSKSNVDELEVCKPKEHGLVLTTSDRKTEVKVEVYQIGAKDFLLKLICGKQGGFQRMIETVNSLGLQVLDVNVTTCYDKVLNILKVEVSLRNDKFTPC
ncbi:transcription factor bHLH90-like [Bidens hawaiensis]|uniref:transcription factor bHLH90-like n=1 Tax=Bidens hawaiensis TaxID=980011 RepID=UPI004049FB95